MKVDQNILKKLEILSMIEISEENRDKMVENLTEIVNFVENLNELDLENKDSSFSILEGGTPFREDMPASDKEVIDIILKNAPKKEDDFFIVPKIIE